MDELTREIYGNIGRQDRLLSLCARVSRGLRLGDLAAVAAVADRAGYGRAGRLAGEFGAAVVEGFSQRTVRKTERKAGKVHAWLFYGFIVLFIGPCLIAVEEWGHLLFGGGEGNLFHKGLYFVVYEVVLEFGGLLFVVGCGWFLLRMLRRGGGDSVGYRKADLWLLGSLLLIGVSGFVLEGFRIIREATPPRGDLVCRLGVFAGVGARRSRSGAMSRCRTS